MKQFLFSILLLFPFVLNLSAATLSGFIRDVEQQPLEGVLLRVFPGDIDDLRSVSVYDHWHVAEVRSDQGGHYKIELSAR